jgi:hypothetical protein
VATIASLDRHSDVQQVLGVDEVAVVVVADLDADAADRAGKAVAMARLTKYVIVP